MIKALHNTVFILHDHDWKILIIVNRWEVIDGDKRGEMIYNLCEKSSKSPMYRGHLVWQCVFCAMK